MAVRRVPAAERIWRFLRGLRRREWAADDEACKVIRRTAMVVDLMPNIVMKIVSRDDGDERERERSRRFDLSI